jgi:hypothetical protein
MVISLLPEEMGAAAANFYRMQRPDRGSIVTLMASQCTIGRRSRVEPANISRSFKGLSSMAVS